MPSQAWALLHLVDNVGGSGVRVGIAAGAGARQVVTSLVLGELPARHGQLAGPSALAPFPGRRAVWRG